MERVTVSTKSTRVAAAALQGAVEVQAQALEYDLTPAEVAEAARGTAAHLGQLASALVNRGKTNCNKATTGRNPDVLRLGEQIGLEVMGPE